ncbi:glutamate racemase [Gloeocapsa sp. PCC 73106]|uniref:glutamate racemase n=1 Tax=Gloeocapsa sp. PCC 73106 TaxID=102232 RepID=UPI0002ACFA51|nr:glutamate racemase [Gloeocapsa sp. PCC 73106]ELR97521.1 glutamate racemase [Gloeocapsa sp. PCC 73106]
MGASTSQKIGVFDSGVGGLTVLRQMYQQLPHESILYFADTARLPYGTRSPGEILQFVREILTWMNQEGVKMVIMACNTSSALALEIVRSEYDLPILGIILPGARAAVEKGQKIGVIATPVTANSHAYSLAIAEINPKAEVLEVGCPAFVPLIEQNLINHPYTKRVAGHYLNPLLQQGIDTLIYGCTHYRHLENVFLEILPRHIQLVDPATYVVSAAARELRMLGLKNRKTSQPTRFCVSGCPQKFAFLSKQWLGFTPKVEKISLPVLPDLFEPNLSNYKFPSL